MNRLVTEPSIRRMVFFLFALMAAIGISIYSIDRTQQAFRSELQKKLDTYRTIAVKAVAMWLSHELRQVSLWAGEPENREAMLKILSPDGESKAALADAEETIRRHLFGAGEHANHAGYLLSDVKGRTISFSGRQYRIPRNLLADTGLLPSVLQGRAVSTPPMQISPVTGGGREPVVLVTAPVRDDTGDIRGALSFFVDPHKGFTDLFAAIRFGKTGETYAVSRKGMMLSESRFTQHLKSLGMFEGTAILKIPVRDPGVNLLKAGGMPEDLAERPLTLMARSIAAGKGGSDLEGYRDYRGVKVVGSWAWLEQAGFGIAVEMDYKEAYTPMRTTRSLVIGLSALVGVLIIGIFFIVLLLRQREEREETYRAQLDTSPDAIMILSCPGETVTEVNYKAAGMWGYGPGEMIGKPLAELLAEESRGRLPSAEGVCCILRDEVFENLELLTKENEKVLVDLHLNPVALQHKRFIQAVFRDASDRLQLQRIRDIYEEVSAYLLTDPEEKELLQKVCSLIVEKGGYRFAWIGFLGEDGSGRMRPVAHAGYEEGYLAKLEISVADDNRLGRGPTGNALRAGKPKVVKNILTDPSYAPWRDEAVKRGYRSSLAAPLRQEEASIGAINVYADEPDRFSLVEISYFERLADKVANGMQVVQARRKEKELMAELESLARFPSENPHPVLRFSAEGVILYANQSSRLVLSMLGCQKGDRLPEKWGQKVAESYEQEKGVEFDHAADGHVLAVVLEPVADAGYVNCYMTDVTKKRAVDKELVKAKEMAETANRMKDHFISLVSHDIRGPLGAVIGYAKLVGDTNRDKLDDDSLRYLESIQRTGQNLYRLTREILDQSRFGDKNIRLKKMFFDPYTAAIEVLRNNRPEAEEKGVTLENRLTPGFRLYTDRPLFLEVLQNLVTNGIKFTGEGGKVTIHRPEGKHGMIAVTDTGVGMTPEQQARIFEFETGSSTMGTDGEEGTGIGLPLCREVIESQGGAITLSSKEGEGSTFYVRLPEVKPVVIVVDDLPSTRVAVKKALTPLDCEVLEAEHGKEALALAKAEKPHLLITDLQMPEMDGFELIKELREDPETRELPVIAITAYENLESSENIFSMGVSDFIRKPVEATDLTIRVRRYIA